MDTNGETMAAKLQQLRDAVDEEDFAAAVGMCEEVLAENGSQDDDEDNNKRLTCVVYEIYAKSLLHEKQYDKVLGLSPPHKECRASLDPLQAYAHYRLDQYDKALQLAQKLKGATSTSCDHIEAQSYFHLNNTAKAVDAYQKLMDGNNPEDDDDDDDEFLMEVYTNTMAVLTANATPYDASNPITQSMRDKAYEFVQSQEDAYDLTFNIASHDLLAADTKAKRQSALGMLQSAQRTCRDLLLADDESQQQLKQELEPMELNLTWAKAFWGEDFPMPSAASGKLNSILKNQINPVLMHEGANKKTNEKTIQALESLLLQGNNNKIKLSALQKRLCRYNMAVLQLRLGSYEACRQALEALYQSLVVPKKKSNKVQAALVIPPPSEAETLWWQVRVDVLSAYSFYLQSNDAADNNTDEKTLTKLQEAIQKLHQRLEKVHSWNKDNNNQKLLDHTALYLQLHLNKLVSNASGDLEWLQTCANHKKLTFPAMTATLAKSYQDQNQPEKAKELLLSQGGNSNIIIAEMAMAQENYDEAVTLYDQALATNPDNHGLRARLVEALSHVDPQRAIQEWKTIETATNGEYEEEEDEEEDGDSLERKELPRIKHSSGGADHGTTQLADAGSGRTKKSKESILRRRERQRKIYLEQQKEKGLYNPLKPSFPDPERWIPKHERQRRRRRGGAQNKASQGGVSAKDAAKLDVAARATGADSGASSGPSTAHLTVAGGSRKGGRRR